MIRMVALLGFLGVVGCGDSGSGAADAPPAGGVASPSIQHITWTHAPGCTPELQHTVTVTVDAVDADTPAGDLMYSGVVNNCFSPITGATSSFDCAESIGMTGSVVVRDPEGHEDSQAFAIDPCVDGELDASVLPDAGP